MLSFLGTIGRMLPGYLHGYRMAIDDNWKDLNQYNTVQRGQMSNAFLGESFAPELNMLHDRASVSRMANLNHGIDFWKRLYGLRGEFGAAGVQSAMAPDLMYQTMLDRLRAIQNGQYNAMFDQQMQQHLLEQWKNGNFNFGLPNANTTQPGASPLPTAAQDPNAMLHQNAGVNNP